MNRPLDHAALHHSPKSPAPAGDIDAADATGNLDPDNLGCEHCDAPEVVAKLDGDRMCQSCADAWDEQPDDDLLPLSHPVMKAALRDWHAKYGGES